MSVSDHIKDLIPPVESNQDEVEQALADFRSLLNHRGWKRIQDVLNKKMKKIEEEILYTDIQGNKLNRLRDKHDLCEMFITIPEAFIENWSGEKIETEVMIFDPYEERKEPVDNQQ